MIDNIKKAIEIFMVKHPVLFAVDIVLTSIAAVSAFVAVVK